MPWYFCTLFWRFLHLSASLFCFALSAYTGAKKYSGNSRNEGRYGRSLLPCLVYFALDKSNSSSFTGIGGERLLILFLWILSGVCPLRHATGGTLLLWSLKVVWCLMSWVALRDVVGRTRPLGAGKRLKRALSFFFACLLWQISINTWKLLMLLWCDPGSPIPARDVTAILCFWSRWLWLSSVKDYYCSLFLI